MKYGCFIRNERILFAEPWVDFVSRMGLYFQFSTGARKTKVDWFEGSLPPDTFYCYGVKNNKLVWVGTPEDPSHMDALRQFKDELQTIVRLADTANRNMLEITGRAEIGAYYVTRMDEITQKVLDGVSLTGREQQIVQLELDKWSNVQDQKDWAEMMRAQLSVWRSRQDTALLAFLSGLANDRIEF